MRTTLSLDDDVASLLKKENKRAGEPMKQTVNRVLRYGLVRAVSPRPKLKRFVVKPFDTGITAEHWSNWDGMNIEEILDEAESQTT